MNIHIKVMSIFHTIWTEIIGNMDLGLIPNRFIYRILYTFLEIYIYLNKTKNF